MQRSVGHLIWEWVDREHGAPWARPLGGALAGDARRAHAKDLVEDPRGGRHPHRLHVGDEQLLLRAHRRRGPHLLSARHPAVHLVQHLHHLNVRINLAAQYVGRHASCRRRRMCSIVGVQHLRFCSGWNGVGQGGWIRPSRRSSWRLAVWLDARVNIRGSCARKRWLPLVACCLCERVFRQGCRRRTNARSQIAR